MHGRRGRDRVHLYLLPPGATAGSRPPNVVVLEPPEFDDARDDDEPDTFEGDESGRAPTGGQDDEATAGESAASEEPDPFGDDLLIGGVVPDH